MVLTVRGSGNICHRIFKCVSRCEVLSENREKKLNNRMFQKPQKSNKTRTFFFFFFFFRPPATCDEIVRRELKKKKNVTLMQK